MTNDQALDQQLEKNKDADAVRPAQGVPEAIVLKQQAVIMAVQDAITDSVDAGSPQMVAGCAEALVNLINGFHLISAPEEIRDIELSDEILNRVTTAVNAIMERRFAEAGLPLAPEFPPARSSDGFRVEDV